MHIVTDLSQVPGIPRVHDDGFVTPAEKVSDDTVSSIEPHCVGAEQPFHAGDQIPFWGLENQVKMIAHEAIRMHLPSGLFASFGQSPEKQAPIPIVEKDGFPPISATYHVVAGVWKFDAEFARHESRFHGVEVFVKAQRANEVLLD